MTSNEENMISVDRKLLDQLLERSYDFERAQSIAKVGSWHLDLSRNDGELRWSDQTYRIFGIEIGTPVDFHVFLECVHPEDRMDARKAWSNALKGAAYDFEHRIITPSGILWVHETAEIRVENGVCVFAVGTVRDITESKLQSIMLHRLAHYDPLTHLPNRTLLLDRLKQGIALAKRQDNMLAVCYLDLDGFKPVNDLCGHEMGDRLLSDIASKLSLSVREADTVARIGGDEFAILLVGLSSVEECDQAVMRILSAVRMDFETHRGSYEISGSIGVTLCPHDSDDPDLLIRHADQAMYMAKEAGKNRFHHFDSVRLERNRSKSEELRRIKTGVLLGEFELHYQPKVHLGTGKVVGFKALARWNSSEGLVSPAKFMPVIEEDPYSTTFGEWALRTALSQMSAWQKSGVRYGSVGVNISPVHLQNPDFSERLGEILAEFPEVEPKHLEIEIVESAAIHNLELATGTLERCRSMGVSFAIDDFGTGYSSLAYLKRIRSSSLKIDQTFVRDMLENLGDLNIVQGVIGLAEAFNQMPVAEGVETVCQAELLSLLGCQVVQGYLVSRPMPAAMVPNWLVTYRQKGLRIKKKADAPFRAVLKHVGILCVKSRHREWCARIWAQLEKGIAPAEEFVTDCRFQAWYEGEGKAAYGSEPWYEGLGKAHGEIHSAIGRVVSDSTSENLEKFERSREEFIHTQRRFIALLDQAFESKMTELTS